MPRTQLRSQRIGAKVAPINGATPPNGKLVAKATTQGLIDITNRDRQLFQLWGEIKPEQLAGILKQALLGSLVWQERLFEKMVDEWPRLQKNLLSLKRDVADIDWDILPYSDKGDTPSQSAQDKAALVERALWGMVADPTLDQEDFPGLIKTLVDAVPCCFSVSEIYWTQRDGEVVPQCARKIPAKFYGYGMMPDAPDQLMLNPQGNLSLTQTDLTPFPENKFVIGVYKSNISHPTTAALLRALTPWWFAQKYGVKWFMTYCQMFGTPMRMAEYTPGDAETFNSLCSMLEQMGYANWGVFPAGAKVELLESKATSGSALPQRQLIQDADEQCDIMILGQTLTSSVSSSGGNRALGQVHADTEIKVLNGVADFIESVINTQLIPAIIALNYGETSELPYIEGSMEQPADELVLAQRDLILFNQMKLPVATDFLYERHSVPEPAEDAELFAPVAPPAPFSGGAPGDPSTPSDKQSNADLNQPPKEPSADPQALKDAVKASDTATVLQPSMQMALAAKKGLALRKEHGRGGALSAVTRARDIAVRKSLSMSTVKRMQMYFDANPAHASAAADTPEGIAYQLHGGDAGKSWCEQCMKGT